jgi:hypothetical protein
VALGQVFSDYFGFPWQLSYHQFLHHHNHPGAAKIGILVAATPSEPNLTPYQFIILLLFIITANGFSLGGSDTTIEHNKQITHFTQNNTTIKRNTAHKTTNNKGHTTQNEYKQSQLKLYKLILLKTKILYIKE